jgi:hypothetical protein
MPYDSQPFNVRLSCSVQQYASLRETLLNIYRLLRIAEVIQVDIIVCVQESAAVCSIMYISDSHAYTLNYAAQ